MGNRVELTQIVKEVQNDIGKFELLYSQIISRVYFWCYSIAGDESTANDMTQEAMIRIYNKLHTLRTPETFSSWMYRLVRNSCITYLRNNKRYVADMLDSEDFNDGFETTIKEERRDNLPEEAYYQKETKELVRGFINKLPIKQREVITLFYLEEFKATEIAEVLDRNVVSIRSLLHSGRKSLEKQVDEYQKKHNVKLYTTSILPLLGLILSEYRDDICNRQNLQYNKNLYNVGNTSLVGNLLEVLSSKIAIVMVTVICVSMAVVVIANTFQNQSIGVDNGIKLNSSIDSDLEMFNKSKGHPYIEDITYFEFPMRKGIDVTIELKKDVTEEEVRILFNDEELSFEKNKKNILIQASDNGIYTIITKEYETSFRISNIDAYAPELVEVVSDNGYLELIINDELSQIDYKKSFVENQGNKYQLREDSKIHGEFYGVVRVTIFHKSGDWISYDINI